MGLAFPHPPGRPMPVKDRTVAGPARAVVLVAEALDGVGVMPISLTVSYQLFVHSRPHDVHVSVGTVDELRTVARRLGLEEFSRDRFSVRAKGVWADVPVRVTCPNPVEESAWNPDGEAVAS